jgi:osmotically-inducible protein OsmY
MMKANLRPEFLFSITVASAIALPALAARDERRIDPMMVPSSAVHTGAATYSDQQLASDLVSAISADRAMSGTTMTAVVKDGRITLSGSAKDLSQAARAEKIAKDIAGSRKVEGKLDIQGG